MRLMVMLCVVMMSIGVLGVSAQNDDPTFEYSVIDDQFRHAQMIQTVDIDVDGDEDVILASSLNDTIYLYLNDGSGESWERVNVAPENSIVAMQTTVADFDMDGDLDIASVGLFDRVACVFCSAGVVHWYENMGDNTEWTTHVIDGELWGAFFIDTYDYLDDGVPDLIVSTIALDSSNGGAFLYHNTGDGWEDARNIDEAGIETSEKVFAYDVDGDQNDDIVVVNTDRNELNWYQYDDSSDNFEGYLIATINRPRDAEFINLDDDDAEELIVTSDDGIWLFDMPDDPTQAWVGTLIDGEFSVGYGGNGRIVMTDLNGDDLPDIAVALNNLDIGYSGVYWYRNDGAGIWTAVDISNDYYGVTDIISADLNGDERTDLLTSTYNNTDSNDQIGWWANLP